MDWSIALNLKGDRGPIGPTGPSAETTNTGATGPMGPTGDSSRWAEYPASAGPVDINNKDIVNVSTINTYPISRFILRPQLLSYQSDDSPSKDLSGLITGTSILLNSYSTPPEGFPYDGVLMFQLNYNVYSGGFDGAIKIILLGNGGDYEYTNTIYAGASVPNSSFVTTLGVAITAGVPWEFNNYIRVIDEINSTVRTSWVVTYYPNP